MRDALKLWSTLHEAMPENEGISKQYRVALAQVFGAKHARHHHRRPGGLRARVQARRARGEAGYCRHGVYVGGCGADYMCGACENGEHWQSSMFSKSERVNLAREYERMTPSEQAFYPEMMEG